MAQHSGFYNAILQNGNYDRTYNADDYTKCLKTIISSGVLRSENDDYKVTASGMVVTVGVGFAMIEGRYAENDTPYTFTVPIAHNTLPRIDRVVLRSNNNMDTRDTYLYYLEGEADTTPVAPELTRAGGIYDICLAEIEVQAQATSVTVTDTRSDNTVCGWLYSVVGDGSFFTSLDAEFNEWLQEKKNDLASVTLFKRYQQRIVTTNDTTEISFNIPEYDPTGVDIVEVYVNGMRETEGTDWTISGSVITFVTNNSKIAGTEIDVVVYKSIDGTGLGDVSEEITELQNKVATLGDISDYNYICTGLNDNIALSQLAESFLSGENTKDTLTIHVYGTIGIGAPYAGDGTAANRYKYFAFGLNSSKNRKVIFDFENSTEINVTCGAGTHNIIFYGQDVNIKNASVVVDCSTTTGSCVVFSSTSGEITAEDCRFEVEGYDKCYIAGNGTFTRCFGKVTNTYAGFCFDVSTNGLLKLYGGEFYAYAKSSSAVNAVVNIEETATQAVAVLYGANCPTVSVAGAYQTYAVRQLAGHAMCYGTITALTISTLSTSLNSGQINRTKPGRL